MRLTAVLAAVVVAASVTVAPASATPQDCPETALPERDVRFATFNASLNRRSAGELVRDLSTPDNEQARNVAETIQRTRPDVVLINEFDHDDEHVAAALFQRNYLGVPQRGAEAITYPYRYVAPSNTGIPSGVDLDNNGSVGGPGDALGFGFFPGQYGMVVYSMFPIQTDGVRTFQKLLWKDMPGNLMPTDYYSPAAQQVLRLSSKSHWDLPLRIGWRTVHFLVSHPTPPVFDGPEDRNGRRNHDEIRLWADYVSGGERAAWIRDDRGVAGGLPASAAFVIAGDQNADPLDGDSTDGAIGQLLGNWRINNRATPGSDGAVEQSKAQGGINAEHRGNPRHDTADFNEPPGNVRVDYVLPSWHLHIRDSGVFWPTSDDPLFRLTGTYPFPTSDHRLVWVDVDLPHRNH